MAIPRLTSGARTRSAAVTPTPVSPAPAGALRITLRRCRPARFQSLFHNPDWAFLQVDVELENLGPSSIPMPRGESVVLVDGVGYAYHDRRRLGAGGSLAPGATRTARYLFRVPVRSLIGRLRIVGATGQLLASTGFIDLKVGGDGR